MSKNGKEIRKSLKKENKKIFEWYKGMVILCYFLGLSVCPVLWASHNGGNGI